MTHMTRKDEMIGKCLQMVARFLDVGEREGWRR